MTNPADGEIPPDEVPLEEKPGVRVARAVAILGEDEVVERSIALLAGQNAGEEFLLYVGGVHARGILDGAPPLYWPEVWGARALLYAWNDSAREAVVAGLGNQAWRVREMCARVVGARRLDAAVQLRELLGDSVGRVRTAAARALSEVGDATDADAIRALFLDPDIEVRRGADQANRQLAARFPDPV
jgi:HEAT repeats